MITVVTLAEVDRLFYERLRLAAISAGLTVDVTAYNNGAAYQVARNTLKATLTSQNKTLVEVIGVGAWDDRKEMSDSRIVVNRMGTSPGSIGGSPAMFYESYVDNNGADKFNKKRYPDRSTDIDYEVRLITNDEIMERILSSLIGSSIGQRRYLSTVDDNGFTANKVLVLEKGSYNMSTQSFVERGFRYTVEDAFLTEPEVITTNIPKFSTVEFSLYLPDSQTVSDVFTLPVALPTPSSTLPFSLPFNV